MQPHRPAVVSVFSIERERKRRAHLVSEGGVLSDDPALEPVRFVDFGIALVVVSG